MNSLTFLGGALLVITLWECTKDKTDSAFIFELWSRFNISKASTPLLYWLVIFAQAIGGAYLMYLGIKKG